jgi:hypothetical protein
MADDVDFAAPIKTSRGPYRLALAAPLQMVSDSAVLTLALERADGIERVVFRCRIATVLLGGEALDDPEGIVDRLAPWVEREFEQMREAAFKAIRTERKPLELVFVRGQSGPF